MALSTKQLRELRETGTDGNRVGYALRLSGLTQAELADATGFPQPYISDVSRSRYQTITVDNARRFAEFFGCSIEDLFPPRDAEAVGQ